MSRAYRNSVRIERDKSADGVLQPDYLPELTGVPCKIESKQAFELRRGRQIEAIVSHVVSCRFVEHCKPDDVLVDEDTDVRYLVKGVIDVDKRNRDMIIYCTEVVS